MEADPQAGDRADFAALGSATARILAAGDVEQVAHAVVETAVSVPGVTGARFCLQRSGGPLEFTAVSGSWGPGSRRRRGWMGRPGDSSTLERSVVDAHGSVLGTLSVQSSPRGEDEGEAGAPDVIDTLASQAGHVLDRLALIERLSRTATRLAAEQARARRLDAAWNVAFEEAPIGMAVVSLAQPDVGALIRVNDALCRVATRSAAQLTASSLPDLVHPDDRGPLVSALARAVGGRRTSSTLVLRPSAQADRDEDLRLRITTTPVPDDDGPTFAVSHIEALPTRGHSSDESGTERDPQTGLLTTVGFDDALERTRSRAVRSATTTAVLLCDLSRVEARAGALSRDDAVALRAELARQVQGVLRPDDAVGLVDPTALGVVLAELSERDAEAVAARVHAAITRTLAAFLPAGAAGFEPDTSPGMADRPAEIAIAMIDPIPRPLADTEALLRDAIAELRGPSLSDSPDPSPRPSTRRTYRPEGTGTKIILWRRGDDPPGEARLSTRVTLWQRPQS